jgi:hypothetical protein
LEADGALNARTKAEDLTYRPLNAPCGKPAELFRQFPLPGEWLSRNVAAPRLHETKEANAKKMARRIGGAPLGKARDWYGRVQECL